MAESMKRSPPLSLIKKRPETAAVISKLVSPKERPISQDLKRNVEYAVSDTQASEISQSISQRIIDADNIFQLFPDMELAAQILISSILSPKDMMGTDLILSLNKKEIPAEVAAKITDYISEQIDSVYKIKNELPSILRQMLFISGGYVQAVLPESSIDQVINQGLRMSKEDIKQASDWITNTKNIGFLGPRSNTQDTSGRKNALESLFQTSSVSDVQTISGLTKSGNLVELEINKQKINVTDDYSILKAPQLIEKVRQVAVENIISKNKDSSNRYTQKDLSAVLYKGINAGQNPFTIIPTSEQTSRKNISRPLLFKLPTESVIPVFAPGDEQNHIGYFVLIDQNGYPVTKSILFQSQTGLVTPLGDQSASMSSLLITRAKTNLREMTNSDLTMDNISQIYSNIVEADLLDRLKNGIYGENVAIGHNLDVYRIMLARSFANQYTKMLYIPREICTYFAFNYYDNGAGKSLVDDLRVMLSLRAIILFSKVMALTKNSIATTHVNMTLDEDDPDPQKTIEMAIHEIVRMRQQYFPLGINSPVDLVDWIQRAGLEFTFEGHPGIPSTKFEFEQRNANFTPPNDELDDTLRKQTYMAIGLSPETVDNGFNSEFATTVVSNNILLSKRILIYGQKLSIFLTEHIKKIIHNDPYMQNEIKKLIVSNIDRISKYLDEKDKLLLEKDRQTMLEIIYKDTIDHFTISLPKPDVTTIETQSAAFNSYSEALDKTLESWINADFITPTVAGKLGDNVDLIKATLKSYFLRKWMSDNGFMTELGDITASDEDGNAVVNLYEIAKNHLDGIIKSSVKFIDSMQAMSEAANTDLKGIEDSGSTSTDTSTTDESTGGGDDFGMDLGSDLGDIDLGAGATPAEKEPAGGEAEGTEVEEETKTEEVKKTE